MKAPLIAIVPGLIALAALLAVGANQPEEQPGGEPVKGLRINLRTDKKAVGIGDAIVLTTTLTNVTGEDFRVYLGSSEARFKDGWFLRRVPEPGGGTGKDVELGPRVADRRSQYARMFQGTPTTRIIPAGDSFVFQTTLPLRSENGQAFFAIGFKEDTIPLDVPAGVHRFRIAYQSDNASISQWEDIRELLSFMRRQRSSVSAVYAVNGSLTLAAPASGIGGSGVSQVAPSDPEPAPAPSPPTCWEGTARSNDVLIRIVTGDRP